MHVRSPVMLIRIRTVLVVGLLSCGCGGGGPTTASPAPAGSLAGSWTGTFTPALGLGTDPEPVRVTASFSQNQQAVSGELRIDAGPLAPPIRLTLDGMFTGTQLT